MKISERCVVANQNLASNAARMKVFGKKEQEEFFKRALERDAKHEGIFDIGLDVAINGMLSGTGTLTVNAVSILIQSLLKPLNESIGAMTDAIGLTKGGREWKQVKAMWEAAIDGFAADNIYFKEGFRKGYSLERDINERQLGMSQKDFKGFLKDVMKVDKPDELNIEEVQDLLLDMQDYMHNSIGRTRFGQMKIAGDLRGEHLVRWPTKMIVGIDEYGKARFRKQQMFQMASKFASEDEKLGLGSYDDLYKQYKTELFKDNDALWDKRLKTFVAQRLTNQEKAGKDVGDAASVLKESRLAVDMVRNDALFNAFQQRLIGVPKMVQDLRHKHPSFALFAPFIKTPWNIIKEGYNYIPLVPMIRSNMRMKDGVMQAAIDFRTNIVPLHGKPHKMSYDELVPRQILGMTMFATVGAMYEQDMITGSIPRNPAERQRWKDTGINPYSIKIGDKWISYHRFEPLATPLSMAADLFDFSRDFAEDDDLNTEESMELMSNIIYALKSNLTSKTFLEGFHTLTSIIVDPNVKAMEGVIETALRPLTPAIVAQTAKMIDKYDRQTESSWERIQARIPIYREQLPKKYGVYGDAKTTDFTQAVTSIKMFDMTQLTPLQQELSRVEWDKGGIRNNLAGVKLSSEQLAELRQVNAEALTPVLESITSSQGYKNASNSMKRYILDRASSKVRTAMAKQFAWKLRQEDPKFAAKWLSAYYDKAGMSDDKPENLRD